MKQDIGKNLVKASINVAFGSMAINAIQNTDIPQPLKSASGIVIGAGLIKDTGKKLKVL